MALGRKTGGRKPGTPNRIVPIAEIKRQACEAEDVTARRVIRELKRIAFADPRKLLSWGPGGVLLTDSANLTDDQAAAVARISQTKTESGGTIRLEMHDKLSALDKLGRVLEIYTERVEHTGEGGGPVKSELVIRRLDR